MTEIRIDIDLPHPPERVWRALTDPQVLREWFMTTEIGGERPDGFTLRPKDEAGFDTPIAGEIVELRRPERLVMRWQAPDLHTVVTVTLLAHHDQCRLTMVQRGFLGTQGTLRRRVLQRTYGEMADGLGAALGRLAERDRAQVRRRGEGTNAGAVGGRRRNDARFRALVPRGASAALAGLMAAGRGLRPSSGPGWSSWRRRHPVARGVAPSPGEALRESPTAPLYRAMRRRHRSSSSLGPWETLRRWARRSWASLARASTDRSKIAIVGSVAVLLLSAAVAVLVERLTEPSGITSSVNQRERGASSEPVGAGGAPWRSDGGEAAASPVAVPAGTQRPALSARYGTPRTMVGGYEASFTINNLTSSPVEGWTVTIVLPPLGLVVHDVQGARFEKTDKDVRFQPLAGTRVVQAGGSVRFTFRVEGVGAPTGCTINDQPCTGIPG